MNEDKTGRNKDVNNSNNIVNHIIHLHLSDLNVFFTFISFFFCSAPIQKMFVVCLMVCFLSKSQRDNLQMMSCPNQKARQLFM